MGSRGSIRRFRMGKRITKLISVILLGGGLLFGKESYQMLNLPLDARSLALGNGSSARNSTLLRNNPASLSSDSKGLSYTFIKFPADIHSQQIQVSANTSRGIGVLKIAVLDYGDIVDGDSGEITNADEVLLEGGFKTELWELISAGLSIGYCHSTISGYKSELLFSKVGIRSHILHPNIAFGLSFENFGKVNKTYTEYSEPIPRQWRGSLAYRLQYLPLFINFDLVNSTNGDLTYYIAALEFSPSEHFSLLLSGSNEKPNFLVGDYYTDFMAGISGGAEFRFNNQVIILGIMNMGPAGSVLGLSYTIMKD